MESRTGDKNMFTKEPTLTGETQTDFIGQVEAGVMQKIVEIVEDMKKKIESSLQEFYKESPESKVRAEYHDLIKEAELQVCDELLKEFNTDMDKIKNLKEKEMINELKEKYGVYKKARTIQAPGKIFTEETLWNWLEQNIPLELPVKPDCEFTQEQLKVIGDAVEAWLMNDTYIVVGIEPYIEKKSNCGNLFDRLIEASKSV